MKEAQLVENYSIEGIAQSIVKDHPVSQKYTEEDKRCMYRECMILSGSKTYYNGTATVPTTQKPGQNRNNRRHDTKTRREERLLMIEVIKTANLLFGSFEPYYIWDFIGRMFEKTCKAADQNRMGTPGEGEVSVRELCVLVDFLLDKVSLGSSCAFLHILCTYKVIRLTVDYSGVKCVEANKR